MARPLTYTAASAAEYTASPPPLARGTPLWRRDFTQMTDDWEIRETPMEREVRLLMEWEPPADMTYWGIPPDRQPSPAETQRIAEEEMQRGRQARRRAQQILMAHLTPDQQQQMERHGSISVRSQHGNVYQIERRASGNVIAATGQQYCLVVPPDIPVEDQMLAQKLMLETDEDRFLNTAECVSVLGVMGHDGEDLRRLRAANARIAAAGVLQRRYEPRWDVPQPAPTGFPIPLRCPIDGCEGPVDVLEMDRTYRADVETIDWAARVYCQAHQFEFSVTWVSAG